MAEAEAQQHYTELRGRCRLRTSAAKFKPERSPELSATPAPRSLRLALAAGFAVSVVDKQATARLGEPPKALTAARVKEMVRRAATVKEVVRRHASLHAVVLGLRALGPEQASAQRGSRRLGCSAKWRQLAGPPRATSDFVACSYPPLVVCVWGSMKRYSAIVDGSVRARA